MLESKIKNTYLYGFVEKDGPDKEEIKGKELFPERLLTSTTVKQIKLWYGSPPGNKEIKALLGIQIKYLNYITGEKKETDYQGAPIEGMDVEVQELEIKEGDHLSKFHIGFEDYITHFMLKTIKGDSIEIGTVNEACEKQSVNEINADNNIILFIKGYYSKNGSLGICFLTGFNFPVSNSGFEYFLKCARGFFSREVQGTEGTVYFQTTNHVSNKAHFSRRSRNVVELGKILGLASLFHCLS